MEDSENISSQNEVNTNISTCTQLSRTSTTTIDDLNADCLRQIIQYLDWKTLITLVKSSKIFFNKIYETVYCPSNKRIIDIHKFDLRDMTTEDLEIILQFFPGIQELPLEVFLKFIKETNLKTFPQCRSLHIYKDEEVKGGNNTLNLKELYKFPFIKNLELRNLTIEFTKNENNLDHLNSVHLENVRFINDLEEDLLKTLITSKLKKLSLLTNPDFSFSIDNLAAEIQKLTQLTEINLSYHYFNYPNIMDIVVKLPSLQIICANSIGTSASPFYEMHINNDIIEKCSKLPNKTIRGLHIEGSAIFSLYLRDRLQDATFMQWYGNLFMFKSLSCLNDPIVLVPYMVTVFQEFLMYNKNLERIDMTYDTFPNDKPLYYEPFEKAVHESREQNSLQKLKFTHKYHPKRMYRNCLKLFLENHN